MLLDVALSLTLKTPEHLQERALQAQRSVCLFQKCGRIQGKPTRRGASSSDSVLCIELFLSRVDKSLKLGEAVKLEDRELYALMNSSLRNPDRAYAPHTYRR